MIRFTCPHCRASLLAQYALIGRDVECRNCHSRTRVPEPPLAEIAPATKSISRSSFVRFVSVAVSLSMLAGLIFGYSASRIGHTVANNVEAAAQKQNVEAAAQKQNSASDRLSRGSKRSTGKRWRMDKLRAAISGLSYSEIRNLLGDPDVATADPPEQDDRWFYKNILLYGNTDEPSAAVWMIRFRSKYVYLCGPTANTPLGETTSLEKTLKDGTGR